MGFSYWQPWWALWLPSQASVRLKLSLGLMLMMLVPASARGALSTALPSPLRTATTCTDTSSPPDTPSASPILALPDLTSRSLVSTLASTTVAITARGATSPSTEELPSTPDTLFPPPRGLLRVLALDTAIRTLFSEPVLIRLESEITISHPHIWHILR